MSTSKIKANSTFVANFMLVSRYYMLEELGELELAKECARNNMAAAEECFAALAEEIRGIS